MLPIGDGPMSVRQRKQAIRDTPQLHHHHRQTITTTRPLSNRKQRSVSKLTRHLSQLMKKAAAQICTKPDLSSAQSLHATRHMSPLLTIETGCHRVSHRLFVKFSLCRIAHRSEQKELQTAKLCLKFNFYMCQNKCMEDLKLLYIRTVYESTRGPPKQIETLFFWAAGHWGKGMFAYVHITPGQLT